MSTSGEKGLPQNRTYTVDDIAAILGIGRTSAYKPAKSGAFKIMRIGNMIHISRKSFEDWLEMEEPEEIEAETCGCFAFRRVSSIPSAKGSPGYCGA